MKAKIIAAMLLMVGISGCGPFMSIQKLETMDESTRRTADDIRLVSLDEAKSMQIIGTVTGHSCKNMLWDPAANAEAATFQVKLQAAQQGATAVSALRCIESGTSLGTNCWQSFSCTGTMLR